MANRIPKQFHFIFGLKPQTEPFHLAYYLCLKSCLMVNRPQSLNFYYHHEPHGKLWELIKPDIVLHKIELETFITENTDYLQHDEGRYIKGTQLDYAHQADFIRLKKLLQHGGVYADIDTLFVNPIPEEFYNHRFIIGKEIDQYIEKTHSMVPSLCNALLMSEPDSAFAKAWLTQSYDEFDGSWSRHSCQLAATIAAQLSDQVSIVARDHFYKHMWTTEGIHTLLEGLDTNFDNVYSMHLWNHLWWDKSRIDFSDFHEGLLTEKYIRETDTTYNVIARQYLPE